MRSVVCTLIVCLLALFQFENKAEAIPEFQALNLQIVNRGDDFQLRVDNFTGEGSLFLYTSPDPSSEALVRTVARQTNVSIGLTSVTVPIVKQGGQRFYRATFWSRFDPGTNMVYIPAGRFTMGSPDSEPARYSSEGPQTEVIVSRGFWMGRYEVTQGEFEALMGWNPSQFVGDSMRPVEQVEWHEAVAYCEALTERERSAGRVPMGYVYRLPTEGEWEYACRAGTSTAFHYGDALRSGMANFQGSFEYPPCSGQLDHCPNPDGDFPERTLPVGSYLPNAWGLHDMHGNVFEWCMDWWRENLPGGSVTDPTGPSETAPKVIRGGGWQSFAVDCRAASRIDSNPIHGNHDVGFRVVLGPEL